MIGSNAGARFCRIILDGVYRFENCFHISHNKERRWEFVFDLGTFQCFSFLKVELSSWSMGFAQFDVFVEYLLGSTWIKATITDVLFVLIVADLIED